MNMIQPILTICVFALIPNIAKCGGNWLKPDVGKIDPQIFGLPPPPPRFDPFVRSLLADEAPADEEDLSDIVIADGSCQTFECMDVRDHQAMVMFALYFSKSGVDLTDVKLSVMQKRYLQVLEMHFVNRDQWKEWKMAMKRYFDPGQNEQGEWVNTENESYLRNFLNAIETDEKRVIQRIALKPEQKKAVGLIALKEFPESYYSIDYARHKEWWIRKNSKAAAEEN